MAMCRPVPSEPVECGGRYGDIAVLGTLASVHVYQSTGGVNVTDLQVQSFFESQSHRVNRPDVNSDAFDFAGVNDLVYLQHRKDFRKCLGIGDFDLPQGRPVSLATVRIEEPNTIKSNP